MKTIAVVNTNNIEDSFLSWIDIFLLEPYQRPSDIFNYFILIFRGIDFK